MLVAVVTTAAADSSVIRIGYFMSDDPYRAAAVNLAIAEAQNDGMLNEHNFRYCTAV